MTSAAANSTDHELRMTRELWLERAIETYWRPRFVEIGYPLPERFHISVGFGHGAKRESKWIQAQCWSSRASKDGINHIFICPTEGDTAHVLALVGHELAHAALDSDLGIQDGHVGRFAEIMTRLGFEGKMTTATPGLQLAAELMTVADALGEYPHGALDLELVRAHVSEPIPLPTGGTGPRTKVRTGPEGQTNRHVLLQCRTKDCACGGYKVRTTQRWIGIGLPLCPLGNQMTP